MLKNLSGEEIFNTMQSKPPLEQLEAFSFCTTACTCEKTQTLISRISTVNQTREVASVKIARLF